MTQTEARIIALVREHFGNGAYPGSTGETVEAVMTLDSRLDAKLVTDMLLDSLDLIEFTMALEDEFRVEISDDEAAAFIQASLRDVAVMVDAKVGGKARAA